MTAEFDVFYLYKLTIGKIKNDCSNFNRVCIGHIVIDGVSEGAI